jgi:hypothetical protein
MIRTLLVERVTPVMIGGENDEQFDDPPTLRVPAIRAMLRFWTRAIAGPGFSTIEASLWGSTRIGQGISVLCAQKLPQPPRLQMTIILPNPPHGAVPLDAVQEGGAPVRIRFRLPDPTHQRQLQAVVWTWLNLGTIGRRARRGYGSLQWVSSGRPDDLLEGFSEPRPQAVWETPADLENHLRVGFAQVQAVFPPMAGGGPGPAARSTCTWFQVSTIDQIFVGRPLQGAYHKPGSQLEQDLHGMTIASRSTVPGEPREMGQPKPRLASPMMWRLFRAPGGFIPVMTWSPIGVPQISKMSGMYKYLNGKLGFDLSLAGNPLGF